MTNSMNLRSHIYGIALGEVNRLYIGCARHGADFDKAQLMSELEGASRRFGTNRPGDERAPELDAFELESCASELEASEALDFWRNYFRSLGFELDAESD